MKKQFNLILVIMILFQSEMTFAWMPMGAMWNRSLNLLAGGIGADTDIDGDLASAAFSDLRGITFDPSGNMYIVEASTNLIRKITPGGVVSVFAGGTEGTDDGTGTAAQFYSPSGIVSDSLGNLYVADKWNQTIRKITPAGVVTTFAGLAGTLGGIDGTGPAARFSYPTGVAVDAADNIYVASKDNQTIRKITPAGVVTTIAGLSGITGSADGTGTAARFKSPFALIVDASGNIYVTDSANNTIRKVTPGGVVTTIAGLAGSSGSTNGTGSAARFNLPLFIAFHSSGDLLVTENTHCIRRVTTAGVVTTFAGLCGTSGYIDGNGGAERFSGPNGISADGNGNYYVGDANNYLIRKINSAGDVTTYSGKPLYGQADGIAAKAMAHFIGDLYVTDTGDTYFTDTWNQTIRKSSPTGLVTTIAGTPGVVGSNNANGAAASFNYPSGLTRDAAGNLYVISSNCIRKITPAADVTTLAGVSGTAGSTNGTGSAARFGDIQSIVINSTGDLFVADPTYHTIRKITAGGVVTTFAGTSGSAGSLDGTGTAAKFSAPKHLTIDSLDNIYMTDSDNYTIRKITSGGVVTTIAGTAGISGFTDGTGAAASFYSLADITVDTDGTLYVYSGGNAVRKITPGYVVTTVVGDGNFALKLGPLPASIFGVFSSALFVKKNKLYITSNSSILWTFKP
jgi:sugar lactone lactonase YvrE